MVWMRSALGLLGQVASRARAPCASAAAASARRCGRVPASSPASCPRSARVTRARISAAALRVKVIARICPGSSTVHSSAQEALRQHGGLAGTGRGLQQDRARRVGGRARAPRVGAASASLIGALRAGRPLARAGALADAADVDDVAVARRLPASPGRPAPRRQERADQALDAGRASAAAARATGAAPRRAGPFTFGSRPRLGATPLKRTSRAVTCTVASAAHVLAQRGQVGEQLRVRGALAVPVGALAPAALVVEDHAPLRRARRRDPGACAGARPPTVSSAGLLGAGHAEGRARALELAQPPDEPLGAAAFALEHGRQLH